MCIFAFRERPLKQAALALLNSTLNLTSLIEPVWTKGGAGSGACPLHPRPREEKSEAGALQAGCAPHTGVLQGPGGFSSRQSWLREEARGEGDGHSLVLTSVSLPPSAPHLFPHTYCKARRMWNFAARNGQLSKIEFGWMIIQVFVEELHLQRTRKWRTRCSRSPVRLCFGLHEMLYKPAVSSFLSLSCCCLSLLEAEELCGGPSAWPPGWFQSAGLVSVMAGMTNRTPGIYFVVMRGKKGKVSFPK